MTDNSFGGGGGDAEETGGSLSTNLASLSQICGRGDTVEALTHVLAQQRRAAANPRSDIAVASVSAGTGRSSEAAEKGIPSPAPQSLSQDDFAKVRAAVLDRDGWSKNSPPSPPVPGTGPGSVGGPASSQGSGATPTVPGSPSTVQQQHQQKQSRWVSAGGGGSPADTRTPDGASGGRIDPRLFAPVLRAILAGEGDHVLRRSLLCHPFLKAGSKTSGSVATGGGGGGGSSWGTGSKGSGSATAASSPLGGGRRKDGKGSRGGKAKKRDRDRASKSQDDFGPQGSPSSSKAGGGGEAERSSPLDVSAEMGRLTERAASDRSLQSTLILVKTLLCAVDPGTKSSVLGIDSPRGQSQQQQQQQGGRAGRTQAAAAGPDDRASSTARRASMTAPELTIRAAPLKALTRPGLSGWADMMELLRREKYRERMVALRGQPSLTVCSGKAEIRGRLEVKGESSGVVTAVH
ncbi:unnamed protein product, partial [Scytosiphon promiscuus]